MNNQPEFPAYTKFMVTMNEYTKVNSMAYAQFIVAMEEHIETHKLDSTTPEGLRCLKALKQAEKLIEEMYRE